MSVYEDFIEQDHVEITPLDPLNFSFFHDNASSANDDVNVVAAGHDNDDDDDDSGGDEEREYWTKAATSSNSIKDIFSHAPYHTDFEQEGEDEMDVDRDREEMEKELERSKLTRRKKVWSSDIKKKTGPAKGYVRCVLSPMAQKELGTANSAFLDGDYELALEICQGIVKEFPEAAEPYQTMAMIYEDLGDKEKCILFYMIAAHLRPGDANLWKRNAQLARENEMLKQAAYCLRKAIKAAPETCEFYEDCAQVLLDLGNTRKALKVLLRLFALKHSRDLELAQDISQLYVEMDDPRKALFIYKTCLRNLGVADGSPVGMTVDQINVLCELEMLNRNFELCAQILESSLEMLNNPPIDLKIKLAICYIQLGRGAEASNYFDCLEGVSVKDAADLFYDIAAAYFEQCQWQDSLNLLRMVQAEGGQEYNEEKLWLRMALCLENIDGCSDEAVAYYLKVVDLCPDLNDLRFLVSDWLFAMHRFDQANAVREAINVTQEQMDGYEYSNEFKKLYEFVLAEKAMKRREEFERIKADFERIPAKDRTMSEIVEAEIFLGALALDFRKLPRFFKPRLQKKQGGDKPKRRRRRSISSAPDIPEEIHSQSEMPTDSEYETCAEIITNDEDVIDKDELIYGLSVEDWFTLNCIYCETLICKATLVARTSMEFSIKNYEEIDDLHQRAFDQIRIVSRCAAFKKDAKFRDITRLMYMGICSIVGDAEQGYSCFRSFHQKHANTQPWVSSLFQMLTPSNNDDAIEFVSSAPPQKYLTRYLKLSNNKDPYLIVNLGYMLMLKRGYINSLQYFGRAHHFLPEEDLLPLLLAAALLQRATQRKSLNRHADVLQALAFFEKYKAMRAFKGNWALQECHFNMARLLSHLGLFDLAVVEYQRCLDVDVDDEYYDLKFEAAHNLCMVYTFAGADVKARAVAEKYLEI